MQDLNDLFYFSIVVEKNGFAAAGRALGIPKSRLSRRVAQLEERLGVRLLQRSTRRFAVTDAGQRFYRHCQAVMAEAQAAEDAVAQLTSEPRGLVRMSCPVSITQNVLSSVLPGFAEKYPQVKLLILSTNRRIDLINENIDEEGIDRAFDSLVDANGWLIFYGHDVTARPSPFGCTPSLLRYALDAAAKRNVAIKTVAGALDAAGV